MFNSWTWTHSAVFDLVRLDHGGHLELNFENALTTKPRYQPHASYNRYGNDYSLDKALRTDQ